MLILVNYGRSQQIETGAAYKFRGIPWRFGQLVSTENHGNAIVIGRHSSERRIYIPLGLVNQNTIVGDSAFMLANAKYYDFGVLMSKMHNVWTRFTSGRLESRI